MSTCPQEANQLPNVNTGVGTFEKASIEMQRRHMVQLKLQAAANAFRIADVSSCLSHVHRLILLANCWASAGQMCHQDMLCRELAVENCGYKELQQLVEGAGPLRLPHGTEHCRCCLCLPAASVRA